MMLLLLLLWMQPVRQHLSYPTEGDAPEAYRHRDPGQWVFHRYNLLIGENGDYCVVPDDQYQQVNDGEMVDCRWEIPHLGGR